MLGAFDQAVSKAVAFQLSCLAYHMPSAIHEHVSPRVGSLGERQQSTTTADISQSYIQATATSALNGIEQTERGVPPQTHVDSTRARPRQSPATLDVELARAKPKPPRPPYKLATG
jgi:hypothetical protein